MLGLRFGLGLGFGVSARDRDRTKTRIGTKGMVSVNVRVSD